MKALYSVPAFFPYSLDPILNLLICFQPRLLRQEVVEEANQHGDRGLEKNIDHLQGYPILHDSMKSLQIQTEHEMEKMKFMVPLV